ncbi:AAA family ATPase [Teredinibacter purpureus]|uniref:AAA family ATPase n=1 Tax=Teredinibacter purpureus TaxID=2731756 RepID=UPI0005F82CA7|nr:MoxR family ATPase [Teredinibacter purpureus]
MTTKTALQNLRKWMDCQIIGQPHLIDRLLIALIADGHLLVEGAPGLAKTKAIKILSEGIEGNFHRVQFTPDLLPSDVTGTDIYRPEQGTFEFQPGPIFHNLVLADEINRAPAKVQSALLEAMAEGQISVGKATYPLPDLFLVMATQNPIEQEGTYPLPEAQLDRFLMHVEVGFPDAIAEKSILKLSRAEASQKQAKLTMDEPISQANLFSIREEALAIHMEDTVEDYIVQLTDATRNPQQYGDDLARWLDYGVSPRATISLDRCARAHAWLSEKDYVSPEDVRAVVHDVFRHRLILSFEAEANGQTPDMIIDELINRVPVV